MPDSVPSPAGTPRLTEPVATFFAATAVASLCYWLGTTVPLIGANLHGIIAIVFLYAPAAAAHLFGRPFDYREAGLRAFPLLPNLAVAGLAILATWPLFFGGFLLFYNVSCGPGGANLLGSWSEVFAPACAHFTGLAGAHLRLPENFLLLAASQVIAIALPEEFFFRGYLLGRFEDRWPSRRRLWGAPVGRALLASSVLFALGHVLVDFDPLRLVVFFPALVFGWMRARTGSLLAGALFHALCNLLSDVLYASFFR